MIAGLVALFGEHDAAVMIALIGAIASFAVVMVQQRKIGRSTEQINRAVNHVAEGEPPLIERVRRQERHGEWEIKVMLLFAQHLGLHLPPHPDKEIL